MGFKDFFRNDSQYSSMRLMAFICVLSACFCALVLGGFCIFTGKPLDGIAVIVGALLVPAFGGKVGQAITENKTGGKDEDC